MIALLLLAVVAAAATEVKVCGWYLLTFADNHDLERGLGVGDDFFADIGAVVPSLRPARGALIRLVRSDRPEAPPLESFAAWNGPDAGCVDLTVDPEATYDIVLVSLAEVNGTRISVRDPHHGHLVYAPLRTEWRPEPSASPVRIDGMTGLDPAWQMASVLGWAMKRRSGGVSAPIVAYPGPCVLPDGTASTGGCAWIDQAPDGARMVIYNDRPDWKYRTAHELGHALQTLVAGTPRFDRTADPGDCYTTRPDGDVWEHNSREHQSLAAFEGFAEFYAALVFNRAGVAADCYLHTRNPVDWDLDGQHDTVYPSCAAEPYAAGEPPGRVDAADYLGDWCGAAPNRATVYDQVRFYWALTTSPSRPSLARLLAVWVHAEPSTWNPADGGSPLSAVARRLEEAASAVGLGAEWRYRAGIHGVDR